MSGDPLFLNTGTTLEILRAEGKIPDSNDLFIRREICLDRSWFKSFNIFTGILLGPDDLEAEKVLIILLLSYGVLGFFMKLEK